MPHRPNNPIRCEICARPVFKGRYRNIDSEGIYCDGDWVVCDACLPLATLGDEKLRACLRSAIIGIHQALGLKIRKLRGVRYMTRKEIWSIRRHKAIIEGLPGAYSLGIANTNAVIVLRQGIDDATALITMAHELAHIWQFENWPCFGLMEKWQVEGFAEWVAYKVALSLALTNEADQMLKNPDPVYGAGLRRMLEVEQKMGKNSVLEGVFLDNQKMVEI